MLRILSMSFIPFYWIMLLFSSSIGIKQQYLISQVLSCAPRLSCVMHSNLTISTTKAGKDDALIAIMEMPTAVASLCDSLHKGRRCDKNRKLAQSSMPLDLSSFCCRFSSIELQWQPRTVPSWLRFPLVCRMNGKSSLNLESQSKYFLKAEGVLGMFIWCLLNGL